MGNLKPFGSENLLLTTAIGGLVQRTLSIPNMVLSRKSQRSDP